MRIGATWNIPAALRRADAAMWSLALAWENLWGSSEEFLRRLGPRYVANVYRVVATLTSAAQLSKRKHALQREVSAMQLVAVALTLVPYEHGAYVHSAGIQAFALGVMLVAATGHCGAQALYCAFTNALAHVAWTVRRDAWPMNAMTMYEYQIRCMMAGVVVGTSDLYRRAKLWYIELMAAQDAAERENAARLDEKKTE